MPQQPQRHNIEIFGRISTAELPDCFYFHRSSPLVQLAFRRKFAELNKAHHNRVAIWFLEAPNMDQIIIGMYLSRCESIKPAIGVCHSSFRCSILDTQLSYRHQTCTCSYIN